MYYLLFNLANLQSHANIHTFHGYVHFLDNELIVYCGYRTIARSKLRSYNHILCTYVHYHGSENK